MRRRELLLAAAGLTLAAPAAARAAAPSEGGVLLDLMAREQRAKLAYAAAIKKGGPAIFAGIRANETDHADALATELAAIGLGRPLAPPLDATAQQLADRADAESAIKLETELVDAYVKRAAAPAGREDRDDRRDHPRLTRTTSFAAWPGGQLTSVLPSNRGDTSMPFNNIGPAELIIVLVIALLVIGPKKLPEVGKSLGKGMREFKDSLSGESKDEEEDVSTIHQQVK